MKSNIFLITIFLIFLLLISNSCDNGKESVITNPPDEEPDQGTDSVIIEPCLDLTFSYPASVGNDPDPMIESNDITIGWISRLPKIGYAWDSNNPEIEGWPASGQTVTWQAHIKNWSDSVKNNIGYKWILDGSIVDSGRIDLNPGVFATIDYNWNWEFNRRELVFYIDTDNTVNNKLAIFTDAISLGLYIEQSLYKYFHENQHKLGIGSNSFEGWAQRQIRFYNELFKDAIYEETPNGVLDRIRIDEITIVSDDNLPLVQPPGEAGFDPRQAIPNFNDRTVDLQWGFPSEFLNFGTYSNHTSLDFNNQFYFSGFLQHELGHARYLADVYGFDLFHGSGFSFVDIKHDGQLIAGTKYLPSQGTQRFPEGQVIILHETLEKGLMHTQWRWMDRYSAVAMNLIKGRRATVGNYNGSENSNIFMNDLPIENRFKIKDKDGKLLRNSAVHIYQSSLNSQTNNAAYPKYFDDVPDLEFETDENAQVLLGQNPFSKDGGIIHDWRSFSNVIFIMRVESESRTGFKIIEVSRFNLEYWKGNTEVADYEVCIPLF